MINDVLDIAGIESDRLELAPEAVQIAELVSESIGLMRPLAAARGIEIEIESGPQTANCYVRADLRRSFDSGNVSFSAGLGLSAALYGRQAGSDLPNVDLGALHGYGFDIPLLIGWESSGGIYKVWGGGRGGFERDVVESLTSEPKPVALGPQPIHLDADRFWGGAVAGIATGFNHVHVALELSAAYQVVNGNYNDNHVTVRGVTLAPATALWWSF